MSYFFLYPAGHLGFTAVTFLVTLPFIQVIVVFWTDLIKVVLSEDSAHSSFPVARDRISHFPSAKKVS